jgi:hypothetical protein
MSRFVFESYEFDELTGEAVFNYSFDGQRQFKEIIQLQPNALGYNEQVFEEALFLAFVLIGISYYKTFPTTEVSFASGEIDQWQAKFLNSAYQEGLGQYAAENSLKREDLAHFYPMIPNAKSSLPYSGEGILSLQSGGKDSLLTASLLQESNQDFTSFYVTSGDTSPSIFSKLGTELVVVKRRLDREALGLAASENGKNGHVPVTYIVMSIALLQAILMNKKTVIVSIGHEGEEPREWIDDLPVNHQWSKTWEAEQLFSDYVKQYVSSDIQIGSPLRRYSELRIAELFVEKAWQKYGHDFSSCNVANYLQGADNTTLRWCGECPKCANSFLLFAPFVEPDELKSLFNGQDLFAKPLLEETFKGLLAIDNVPKPFECVGETDELRYAYGKRRKGYQSLSFEVPSAEFDYKMEYPLQDFAAKLI